MPDFGGGYQSDRGAGGNGFGSSGRGGPGNVGGSSTHGNSAERNSLYGYDPRTGRVVQVGAPSRLNGMLTTAAGYNLNRTADRANGGLGLLGYGINDARSPFSQGYKANRQKNIKTWAADRQGAYDAAYDSIFSAPNTSWDSKMQDLTDLKSGLLGALEERGRDMSSMRATHNAGPWGSMFGPGTTADDVETMAENNAALGKVDPNNPMGYSAMGFLSNYMTPAVGNALYGVTESPEAATIGAQTAGLASKALPGAKPSGIPGYVAKAASFAGVPGVNTAANVVGLMERAGRLGYSGYTGRNQNRNTNYEASGGNDWIWRYPG